MTSSERNETGAPRGQEKPAEPSPQCCGGDFAPFGWQGGTGCSPGQFMAGMARPASEGSGPATGCPMAKMCEGMMKGGMRGLGLFLLIPAALLLTLGVAILLVPKVLTWLVAGGLIAVGGLILVAAYGVRRPSAPEA